jgi:hypothetical protein
MENKDIKSDVNDRMKSVLYAVAKGSRECNCIYKQHMGSKITALPATQTRCYVSRLRIQNSVTDDLTERI